MCSRGWDPGLSRASSATSPASSWWRRCSACSRGPECSRSFPPRRVRRARRRSRSSRLRPRRSSAVRTRVDVSDLVASLVLGPAWWWLGREHDARRDELRVALGVVSGLVAMLTVTATSCALHDQVEHLVRRPNGALVAAVREDYKLHGAVSRDGRRWSRRARRPRRSSTADRHASRTERVFASFPAHGSSHVRPTETGARHTDIPGRGGGIARMRG